ncbi:uncharacterized protein [Palaemon carinicauda]|uniref:uncharacterized protein n=1 Tax=Palaemon carinicauda TaxID=392227 RepID=UPI0035B63816
MLVKFARRNNLEITSTLFYEKEHGELTWTSPNGEAENGVDFILTEKDNLVKDETVLHTIKSSELILARREIYLDLRKDRERLIVRKRMSAIVSRERSDEFSLAIQNSYSQ